jgi:hypothetical protein
VPVENLEGPFVTIATLCERVEPRPDGQLNIIGSLQRTTVKQTQGAGPVPFPSGYTYRCWAIVALCAGDAETTYHVELQVMPPAGTVAASWRDEVRFRGGAKTHAIVSRIFPFLWRRRVSTGLMSMCAAGD